MARTFETAAATNRLGLDDPDHKNPTHDSACQYLGQISLSDTVLSLIKTKFYDIVDPSSATRSRTVAFERRVIKGAGTYASLVGFVDLVINFRFTGADNLGRDTSEIFTVAFEVKTAPCAIGEVIRQIGLYREYCTELARSNWVLATTFPISANDAAMLASCAIGHVRLGDKFKAFHEASRSTDSNSAEI